MQKQWAATITSKQLASVHILHNESYLTAYSKVLQKNKRMPQEGPSVQHMRTPKGNGGKQQHCGTHLQSALLLIELRDRGDLDHSDTLLPNFIFKPVSCCISRARGAKC